MKETFKKNFYIVSTILIAFLVTIILVATALSKGMEERNNQTYSASQPSYNESAELIGDTGIAIQEERVIIHKNEKPKRINIPTEETKKEEAESTTESSTEESTKVTMATAETQESTASYETQWNKGYLLALDYPNTSYSCRHVELSDENRAIVESICMAENEAGGFIGAALVAQSLKNAMVYYGSDNVAGLLGHLHYTKGRNANISKDVRDAVIYIFDMDKNAVQHRILFKYKPEDKNKLSEFHEDKEYVCTYNNVRFFDEP